MSLLGNFNADTLFRQDPFGEWYCAIYREKYVLAANGEKVGDELKGCISGQVAQGDGMNQRFTKGTFVKLHLNTKRPKFGKGFKVLSLKSNDGRNPDFSRQFFPGTIVSGPEERNGRMIYQVKFDDNGSIQDVYDYLIVPPKEYWDRERDSYYCDDSSSDSESETESESDSESDSEEKKKSKHKHHKQNKKSKQHKHSKHHKHHKHGHKNENANVIIIPIMIPYPSLNWY